MPESVYIKFVFNYLEIPKVKLTHSRNTIKQDQTGTKYALTGSSKNDSSQKELQRRTGQRILNNKPENSLAF
jgi:hypothetical protein